MLPNSNLRLVNRNTEPIFLRFQKAVERLVWIMKSHEMSFQACSNRITILAIIIIIMDLNVSAAKLNRINFPTLELM